MSLRVRTIATPLGPARAHVHRPGDGQPPALGTLVLGHGAGGGVESADLLALTALTQIGWCVVLLEQPWRVAGRVVAGPPSTLDRATSAAVDVLLAGRWALPRPLVLGGRSAGARVAARLAATHGAAAVVALAFPLAPPQRPGTTRIAELLEPPTHGIPTLVVQGHRDRFGTPEQVRAAVQGAGQDLAGAFRVHGVAGDHGPARDLDGVRSAVGAFLAQVLPVAGTTHRSADRLRTPEHR